jgi:hypothetical protein
MTAKTLVLTTESAGVTLPSWPDPNTHDFEQSPPPTACTSRSSRTGSSQPASDPAPPAASPSASEAPRQRPTGKPQQPNSRKRSKPQQPPTASDDAPSRWTPKENWPGRQPWHIRQRTHVLLDPRTWRPIRPENASSEDLDYLWAALHAWEQQHLGTLIADVARRLRLQVENEGRDRLRAWAAEANERDAA